MFFLQIMMMALRGLRANLLRSLLATIGVIIGVGAVISAMSILSGTQRNISERFETLGSESLTIIPGAARSGGRTIGSVQTLTLEDADALGDPRVCPNVNGAAPEVMGIFSIKYFSRNKEVTVLGTNEAYSEMFNYKIDPERGGRFITREDIASEQKVVVLGHKVARDLFGNGPVLNTPVKIKGISFRVIGVMEKKGYIGFRPVDSQVIVPVTTGMNRLLGVKSLSAINVRAQSPERIQAATNEIKRELRRRHDISIRNGQKDDFEIFSQEEFRKQFGEVTAIMGFVLYSIAGISLVVGGIGIMNIMLVSVTERTREIGVRMAVGAARWDILKQFLIEASIISLLGGGFGVAVGYAMTDLLEKITQDVVETYTTGVVVVYALTMAILTGVLSGLYPAWKASRLDPVEALRYE